MTDWTAQSEHEAKVKRGRLRCSAAGQWSIKLKQGRTFLLASWRVPDDARDGDKVEVTTSQDGEDVFAVRKIGG